MAARPASRRGKDRAALRPLPPWRGPLVAPLALATRSAPFSGKGWVFELKYDGFRLLVAKNRRDVTLRYRSGRDATALFPELVDAVRSLPVQRVLLDGELVVFGRDGRSDFDLLRARVLSSSRRSTCASASACLFDLLAVDGFDHRGLPLVERKAVLRDLLATSTPVLRYVDHVPECGEKLFEGATALRLEGVVAKRSESAYVAGRIGAWLKFKVEDSADFAVIGIADPAESTFWRPSLVLAIASVSGLRYAGRVAIGHAEQAALDPLVPHLRRPSPPCVVPRTSAVWLAPALVCEVRFLASSQRGLRHATFVRFRPDKLWRECVPTRPGRE